MADCSGASRVHCIRGKRKGSVEGMSGGLTVRARGVVLGPPVGVTLGVCCGDPEENGITVLVWLRGAGDSGEADWRGPLWTAITSLGPPLPLGSDALLCAHESSQHRTLLRQYSAIRGIISCALGAAPGPQRATHPELPDTGALMCLSAWACGRCIRRRCVADAPAMRCVAVLAVHHVSAEGCADRTPVHT